MSDSFDADCDTVEREVTPTVRTKGAFWRVKTPRLDEDGSIKSGGFWKSQRAWWNLKTFIRAYVGGYGAGKTNVGCKRAIALALTNAPCPIAVVSPTFAVARQTTILTIAELLAGKQSILGRDLWWKYNASFHEFTIRYRGRTATILIYSGDNPLSLRGPNLAAAYIDEPFIQDQEVFDQMVARVRHPDAAQREIFLTGTPEQLNWGYDLCEPTGDLYARHDVGVITASTRENQALDAGYVSRLEAALDPKTAQAYIDGKFINLSKGRVYYGFSRGSSETDTGNIRDLATPEQAYLGAGIDFNVNPMSASVFWIFGNHMHYFDELELPNADTEYLASTLREKYGARLTDVYPDATGSARKTAAPGGKSDFYYLEQAGFKINARSHNPKRRDRYNAVNGKLKGVNGELTLTVSPKCKKLIKYLSVYSHELMLKQEAMSHLLDSFSYPIAYLYPVDSMSLREMKLTGA